MNQYPEVLEPLLFYILHRANTSIRDPRISHTFKAFLIDEAWLFLKKPGYKELHHRGPQDLAQTKRSDDPLDAIARRASEVGNSRHHHRKLPDEDLYLANPDMDRDLYRRQFNLNDNEIELISTLRPKQQLLIKTPELAKVANLEVDAKSYWLYTNDPFDNRKRREAFETYGFEKGLEILAEG